MKKNNIFPPVGESITYVITYVTRILPYTEAKEIQNIKGVANKSFKELSKKYFYVNMVKVTTTTELIKQTKNNAHA